MVGDSIDMSSELLARMASLEARVAALEAGRAEAAPAPARPRAPEPQGIPVGAVLGLAGRACLILGGGFLLRSLTDSGTLAAPAGVAAGLGYAGFWAYGAHRSGLKGQGPWAAFQVAAAAAIAFPLLWETTVRLKVLPPALAALALLTFTLLLTGTTLRHALRRTAWIVALGALATGMGIMAAASAIVEFCPFFILAGGVSLLLSDSADWRSLRWPAALGADLAVAVMVILALSPGGSEALARNLRPGPVLASALAFVAVNLGVFLHRTLRRPRSVGTFEIVQTLAVLALGLGGAVRVAPPAAHGLLGAAVLLAGLGCYACAFAFVEKQAEGSLDFTYLTSLALVLALCGSLLVLRPGPLALVCLACGGATLVPGMRYARLSLQVHGLVFLAVAAAASGLLAGAAGAFTAASAPPLRGFSPGALLAAAGLAGAYLYAHRGRGPGIPPRLHRIPALGFGALALFALGGLAASALGSLLADPGALAAARTATLVSLGAGCAWAARRNPASELGWLAYPILGATALKLLLEDLPKGRPATMFLAFTLFGAALLAVPRLLGGRGEARE